MAKDLFGGRTIEAPCRVCGGLFPEYTIGTTKLYCSDECRREMGKRNRSERRGIRNAEKLAEIRRYIKSNVDLFGGSLKEVEIEPFNYLNPKIKMSRSGRRIWPDEAPLSFMENSLQMDTDDCIDWPYNREPDGYARIGNKLVTRVVCKRVHGAPPEENYEAAHSCHRGHLGCINWKHLSWKTRRANIDDRVRNRYNKRRKWYIFEF
jgi:hypothetical protein